jgi:hypothetical protein
MVQFTATILKFAAQGEKTGWTYLEIPADIAQKLKPGNKQTFRIKGKLDNHTFHSIALLPMGGGNFIMPLNAAIRKGIRKGKDDLLKAEIEADDSPVLPPPPELMECLEDEPKALAYFNGLPKSHQNYFTKWIESARTEETKARRIAQAVSGLARKMNFGELLRSLKQSRDQLIQ